MISCITNKGVQYITKLEHFRELMDLNVYAALEEYINNYHSEYDDDLEEEMKVLQEENEDLKDAIYILESEILELRKSV